MNFDWRRVVRERVQILSAAAAITLGSLNPRMPDFDLSRPIVFERTVKALRPNEFDPREVVARRVIITLPMDDANSTSNGTWFVPN